MVKGERVERRLTAILAADVAGYSRLMGEDEEGTLTRLKALRREVIDPKMAEHHGRIPRSSPGTKPTGDGMGGGRRPGRYRPENSGLAIVSGKK